MQMVGGLKVFALQNTGVEGKQIAEFLEKLLGVAGTGRVEK